ncbi:hypothetical protein [Agromyces aureus]|uniref:Uncharacterized protein n=1 Tax=Agromyces aureus TaxID=453304 RepID=A0A191WIZ1_9MICO|nr:hypothetical protein [Agromyces aureus]ANJ28182.1 hypothetical protein ATC03_17190 [Agromyces aureus]
MMISELSYLHLQQSEEARITRDLERRREQRERILEGELGADRAPSGAPRRSWLGLRPRRRLA